MKAQNNLLDAVEAEKAMKKNDIEKSIKESESVYLIEELYLRGVTIKEIFGRYYEFEAASDGRTMDVEDAELAGM